MLSLLGRYVDQSYKSSTVMGSVRDGWERWGGLKVWGQFLLLCS